jgi:hypothetical protein
MKGHEPYPNTHRHNAVAAVLQWHGGMDPDTSRTIAVYVIELLDRLDKRAKKSEKQRRDDAAAEGRSIVENDAIQAEHAA